MQTKFVTGNCFPLIRNFKFRYSK